LSVAVFLVGIGAACGEPVAARIPVYRPIHEIAGYADVIVIALPMYNLKNEPDANPSSKSSKEAPPPFPFVVSRVLSGKGVQPGQMILIENDGNNHLTTIFDGDRFQTRLPNGGDSDSTKPTIKATLLFLHLGFAHRISHADYRVLRDRIRILTLGGRTLSPMQWGLFANQSEMPNEYRKDGDFAEMIRFIGASTATIRLQRRMRRGLPPAFVFADQISADAKVPDQMLFGFPILSQSVFSESNSQKYFPFVQPQAD
jgi:hypothetical protein